MLIEDDQPNDSHDYNKSVKQVNHKSSSHFAIRGTASLVGVPPSELERDTNQQSQKFTSCLSMFCSKSILVS